MKNLKFLSQFLIFSILIFSCDSLPENVKSILDTDDLNVQTEIFKIESENSECLEPCAEVSLSYELITGNERHKQVVVEAVNDELRSFIKNGKRIKSQNDLVKAFSTDFDRFKSDFPDVKTPWTIEIIGDVKYVGQTVISYRIETSSYTGGAHSNEQVTLINTTKEGKNLAFRNLVKDRKGFTDACEKAFLKEKGLQSSDDLGVAGYSFENNKFQLSENIGLSKRGFVLYYNNYEISSYAEGSTEVLVPYESVSAYLNFQL